MSQWAGAAARRRRCRSGSSAGWCRRAGCSGGSGTGASGESSGTWSATAALNMFPKFDDVPMSTYLIVFAKILRPSTTPSASTPRSFSRSTTSAASLATSVALSTEIPTSAACSATASFTPSPRTRRRHRPAAPPDEASLLLRAHSGEDRRPRDLREKLVVVEASTSLPVRVPGGGRPSSRADLLRHLGVVARDDLDGDAELVQPRDAIAAASPFGGSTNTRYPGGRGRARPPASAMPSRRPAGRRRPRRVHRRRTPCPAPPGLRGHVDAAIEYGLGRTLRDQRAVTVRVVHEDRDHAPLVVERGTMVDAAVVDRSLELGLRAPKRHVERVPADARP